MDPILNQIGTVRYWGCLPMEGFYLDICTSFR
ncbi:hypothetical protein ABH897_002983 [Paenibacillus sp. RC73]